MKTTSNYSDERIINQIYVIRGMKVMVDSDLAILYGVETKRLKEQVRRNMDRFPEDFMFEMTEVELQNWRSQIATSNALRHRPFCFTEQGVTMLACILNSPLAIQMNIRIIRLFIQMREAILNNKEVLLKVEAIERKMVDHDESLALIFASLKELLQREEIRIRTNDIGFTKSRK